MTDPVATNPSPSWASSITLPEAAAWLAGAGKVAVLTHVKPDGDAVGSSLAVARALNRARGAGAQRAVVVYAGPLPNWLRAVAGPTTWYAVQPDGHAPVQHPDAVVILDTGSWTQLEEVREWLLPLRDRTLVVDHHMQGNAEVATRRVIVPSAAAAAEPAAELCRLILGKASCAELPADIAEALYLGLASDTGWFRHSNVSPSALRLAADLLQAGADHSKIYEQVEQHDHPSRLCLTARALASLELFADGRIALMTIRLSDVHACHAGPSDTGGFADLALSIGSVRVAATITEAEPGPSDPRPLTKISLRSKSSGQCVDVSRVAAAFGGGGHVRAAGTRTRMSMDDARRQLLESLMHELRSGAAS